VDLPATVKAGIKTGIEKSLAEPYWSLVNQTTRGLLAKELQGALDNRKTLRQLTRRIRDSVFGGEVSRKRSKTIAKTETTGAMNAGADLEGKSLAADWVITGKEWLDANDVRTRTDHVDAGGQQVKADEDFTVGGESCSYPGDLRLSAKQRVHCRCARVSVTAFDKRSGEPVRKLLASACKVHRGGAN
jgi:hypothetical protein